jgi:hypothetical protein
MPSLSAVGAPFLILHGPLNSAFPARHPSLPAKRQKAHRISKKEGGFSADPRCAHTHTTTQIHTQIYTYLYRDTHLTPDSAQVPMFGKCLTSYP